MNFYFHLDKYFCILIAELRQPGLLLALFTALEHSISQGELLDSATSTASSLMTSGVSFIGSHYSRARRRLLAGLRHMAIFPLFNGGLVSLADCQSATGELSNIICPGLWLPPDPTSLTCFSSPDSYGQL
ncbi:unnamed protein product [Protopolystoma xenopodis]|uniref:Uncharacterized protein n=1 Tax=Protopolystoma xenopodis TaxID=117903 RepID=A0A3S5BKZ7_9PLAT|nr:unnamed protein product [Protopolystoma xenopodis]